MRRWLAALLPLLVLALTAEPALARDVTTSSDFNGDGFADLAVGVPIEGVGSLGEAGAVNVIYGGPHGLSAARDQFWDQDSPGIRDTAEAGDRFGEALTAGDFDGDGFDDLAIGVPGEDVNSTTDAGAVNVIYGGPHGLSAAGNQLWQQNSHAIEDVSEAGDEFGFALATGDLGRGAQADLAVGAPGEDVNATPDAGAVNVIYGSRRGLSAAGNQLWQQNSHAIEDVSEAGDGFGSALAAANLGRGSRDDLAVGVIGEDVGKGAGAGAVNVIYGGPQGLSAAGNQLWSQDSPGIEHGADPRERFGAALAAADLGRSGWADLAVGAPGEDIGTIRNAGAVAVLYGGRRGLSAAGNQFWSQNSPGIQDVAEAGDGFGSALAAANLGRSAHADLAVSALSEGIGALAKVGAVSVIYGTSRGLSAAGNEFWHEDVAGIPDVEYRFGFALGAADFGRGRWGDLAIGAPNEGVGTSFIAGVVTVIYGRPGGLSVAGNQLWNQDSPGIEDVAESLDHFGAAVAVGGP
jgi:hypothetical protein